MSKYVMAVDIGGTFTDLVAIAEDGEVMMSKVPSTPSNYLKAVMDIVKGSHISPKDVRAFFHGTTIASNTIIEMTGAKTGVLTTRGFRGVLAAARARRAEMFDLLWDSPPPLVPRRHILEVEERVDARGQVVVALNEEDVKRAGRIFAKRGIEAVAVCFINSFKNPLHEKRACAILHEEYPSLYVYNSYETCAEIHEFERMSTTALNAYVSKKVDNYVTEIEKNFGEWGYEYNTFITHSGGGVMSHDAARSLPARISESGPACSVIAGAWIGNSAGYENVIVFDMGGTTAKWATVEKSSPKMIPEVQVGFNRPIRYPAIDETSIGEGGGSIAWVDEAQILRVGPRSAGADPGPACYGLGGTEATITDAQLILKRLDPEMFLGGKMKIDEELSLEAVRRLSDRLGMDAQQTAYGIVQVSTSAMADAGRMVTIQRGYDPRDFALVAFGGAGPVFAVDLARQLNLPKVLVPRYPGASSAFGSALAEVRHDFIRPILKGTKDVTPSGLLSLYEDMEKEAVQALKEEGVDANKIRLQRLIDIRYFQKYGSYFTLPVSPGSLHEGVIEELCKEFLAIHKKEFGYIVPLEVASIEIVNARLVATAPVVKPTIRFDTGIGSAKEALKGSRKVFFDKGWVDCSIYDRSRLSSGAGFSGPAVVEQEDATTIIPPGARATVDRNANLVIIVNE